MWSACGGQPWGGLDKGQRAKINIISRWFNTAATEEETTIVRGDGEEGARRRVAERLNHVVRRRVAAVFKHLTDEVPPSLRKGKILISVF